MNLHEGGNLRFKDVLFALAVATSFGQSLGRLQLQKFVYLADVLAIAWRRVARPAAFSPYLNGPYDAHIQNAVDSLAFRGLAQVSKLSFQTKRHAESTYSLSEPGKSAVERIIFISCLSDDFDLFFEIGREVDRRGWKNIKALVYAEPTYDTARTTVQSGRLRTDRLDGNLSLRILRDLAYAFEEEGLSPISRRNFVQMFFVILDEHAGTKPMRLGNHE